MRELDQQEALEKGAPSGKLQEGIVYWAKE